jgi:hypothetical protein
VLRLTLFYVASVHFALTEFIDVLPIVLIMLTKYNRHTTITVTTALLLYRLRKDDSEPCKVALQWNPQGTRGRGKKKVKQSRYTPWRRLGGEEYSSYSFLTSALDGGEWSASRPGRTFTSGERTPGTHCTGGWVGLRAGLDTEVRGKIFCPCRESNPDRPGRPARSKALY